MYVYIGFFITTNSVAAPTVHSTVHRHFKLQYWAYISIALAAVHHHTHVTCF